MKEEKGKNIRERETERFPPAVPHKSRVFGCFRGYSHDITINTVKVGAR